MKDRQDRVLFLTNHLRGQKASAGTRSWQQTKALSKSFIVDAVLPAIDPVTTLKVTSQLYEGLDSSTVNVHLAPCIKLDRTRQWRRVLFYLVAAVGQFLISVTRKRPSVVLCMSLPLTTILSAWLVSRIKRAPLIVDVRDLPFETALEMGYIKNKTLVKLFKSIETFCLKRAAAIITVSPYFISYLVERGIDKTKIEYAPIGFDDFPPPTKEIILETKKELLSLFPKQDVKTICVYSGTFGHVVEVETVLQAAETLVDQSEIGFVFIGSGQRLKEYIDIAKDRDLNALFLGRKSKEEVHAICNASDICIYSAKNGDLSAAMLGNKVFDYLGANKPIIYSGPKGAVSEIIVELNAGLISKAYDVKSLSKNILSITDNPSLLAKLVKGSGGFRDAGYTAQKSAHKLTELVKKQII